MNRSGNPSAADWRPTCSIEFLRQRAHLLRQIREYFWQQGVLEVETPLLSQTVGTDPQLAFFSTEFDFAPFRQTLYLQTSPEFAMKRLLAAGSGSVYQICKAFRNGEAGRFHNPEFTLLEWYRVGYRLSDLMDDCEALIGTLFAGHRPLPKAQRFSYASLFEEYTGLTATDFNVRAYNTYAMANGLPEAASVCGDNHSTWLDFLFSHKIQPHLGHNALCMVYGYPACQSSLARLNEEDPSITDRVELFLDGMELGNGFYELADANEQERRFDHELMIRRRDNLPLGSKDKRLIMALAAGLPDCSGIAIGIDRLLMALHNTPSIEDVISFSITRA
ncbi:MAG: EF-P lysine aminoacylase EpmA [Gammaproteobacteria bacterium]